MFTSMDDHPLRNAALRVACSRRHQRPPKTTPTTHTKQTAGNHQSDRVKTYTFRYTFDRPSARVKPRNRSSHLATITFGSSRTSITPRAWLGTAQVEMVGLRVTQPSPGIWFPDSEFKPIRFGRSTCLITKLHP